MASILKKQTTFNITNVVANGVATVKEIRSQEQSRKEAEFQKAVAGGLSYSEQIKFREKQLAEATEAGFTDQEYIQNLEKAIATTKQLSRYQGIRERYKKSLDDYTTGKGSLDSYISVLESTMDAETDPVMRNELSGLISQAHSEKAQNDLSAIKNRALVAQKDKSLSLVDSSISEIQSKKALAAINKNDSEVAMWDETLLSLKGTKSKLQIENSINELNFKITKNNPKANDKLSYLNEEISKAENNGEITYNGITYSSLRAFWENKRDEYVANNYFDEVAKEIKAETEKIAATSKFGQIPTSRIQAVSDFYNTIKTKPEFAAYADQVEQRRIESVSGMATDLAESLYNEADENGNLVKAQNAILNLEKKFGVSVSRQPFNGEGTIAGEIGKVKPTTITQPVATVGGASVGEYQVAQGENLTSIAAKNKVSLIDLLESNPEYKRNPSMIKEGVILKIPTTPKPITQETPVAPVTTKEPVVTKQTETKTITPITTPTPTTTSPQTTVPEKTKYVGTSIVDFLKGQGKDSSYNARAELAKQQGINNYTGTADQNIELLNKLNV